VGKIWDPAQPRTFNKGDGSPWQRLNAVYNALKHFDENLAIGIVRPDVFTPMWLGDDGIECGGSQGKAKLIFRELIVLHRDLEIDARWISEEVYRVIEEPDANIKQIWNDLSGKWLELLKELTPGVSRAAILRDLALSQGGGQLGAIQSVAPS